MIAFAAITMATAVAAQESPVNTTNRAAGPVGVESQPQQTVRPAVVANAEESTAAGGMPDTTPEDAPDSQSKPSGSGTALPFDFVVPGESAVPPDLTLASSRPFTLGLGPSAFGPGIRSTVTAGVAYDDNILQDDENPESDLILSGGLNVHAELGSADRGMALIYAINGYLYSDHPDRNSVNPSVGLSLYRRWRRTQVTMAFGYDHSKGSDREVGANSDADGGATTRDTISANLNIAQGLGARSRLTGGVHHTSTFYETLNDSQDTSAHLGFDRQLGSNTRLGIEGVLGSLTGEQGSDSTAAQDDTAGQSSGLDQTYEQVNLTYDYHATDRLNASGSVGWEWRSTDGGAAQGGFVYDLELSYRLGRGTLFTARGSRHTLASASNDNGNRRSTNFELSVSQPIGGRCVLNVAGGFERSDYAGPQGVVGSDRQDDYVYFRPSLSVALTSRLSMSLFYDFRKNESTGADGKSYQGSRVGTQLSYSF